MLAYGLSPERVFGILALHSQQTHATLHTLAEPFVDAFTAEATLPRGVPLPGSTTCS
ncbi:ANTAR domain-containing protein [Rhodococcus sp. JVH1]|uniref:ANTAR domain-containing protein n=1 Tax=Rhodococcus sp. JVH1 TaxID=745408 RepID=UPI000271F8E3|nr:ANTAR domain-containing protein [Rhodococcus sp. JVH1]EJI98921.1 hypothetical protein JVH1_3347 [Rhodococcus sp. JVH1]